MCCRRLQALGALVIALSPLGREWRAATLRRRALSYLLLLLILLGPLPVPAAAVAPSITWDREFFNPQPRPDDVLVPLPCGGAMAFRWVVTDGAVPSEVASGLKVLYGLSGPFVHEDPSTGARQAALLIGKYEVSMLQQSAMQAAAAGPCPPVDAAGRQVQGRVAWQDAVQAAANWSAWLERQAGVLPDCARAIGLCLPRVDKGRVVARLPREVEWEFVARGGRAVTPTQFADPRYPMPEGLDGHAWYAGNAEGRPRPIGYRAPNPLGVHDIYGNVEELQLARNRDSRYPGQVGAAVIRGGSVHTEGEDLSATRRREVPFYGPGGVNRAPDNGYRLVLDRAPGAVVPIALAGIPVAPTATQAVVGHLQINVDVPATVRLDAHAVGTAAPGAPLALTNLAVGEYRLELESEGYTRVHEKHRVEADRWTQVAVAMQPHVTLPVPPPAPAAAPAPASASASGADAQREGAASVMESFLPVFGVVLMISLALMIWRRRLDYAGQWAQPSFNPTSARDADSPGFDRSMWSTIGQSSRREASRSKSRTKPPGQEAGVTGALSAYFDAWRKYSDFKGRANRTQYWSFMLINLFVLVFLSDPDGGFAFMFYLIAILLPSLAVTVRRMHDSNHRGWWLLVVLIPNLGGIFLLVALSYLTLRQGTPDANRFGAVPCRSASVKTASSWRARGRDDWND
ncbi:DUF805 domain-containing protein [Thiocapsa marina]|uniref:Sulphatase-modifying factor protein n=1 Tax=Thiocapsa marina 5811 TaxID=768671 RepID=F9UIS1_9GAMM|nr:DUF805 domain-containing protein [Thiocapsa marina]EGV15902.1 protein of unknown function DUF805 [Thiocapsa marina 5811]